MAYKSVSRKSMISKKSRKARKSHKSISKKSRKARKSVSKKSRKARKSVSKKSRKARKSVSKKSRKAHKSVKKSYKKRKQSGGFNFAKLASVAVNVAKKAAASPELRALGKDLANQGKQMAKQIAHEQINKASNKLLESTGVKVDTRLLKKSIDKHIGIEKVKKIAVKVI